MYTLPYQIIRNKLSANVSEIKDLDWYLQQYQANDKNAGLYDLPGVYVEFAPIDTQQMAGFVQMGTAAIRIHLVTDSIESKGERRIKRVTAKDHAVIMDEIYKTLNGKRGLLHEADGFEDVVNTEQDFMVMNSMTRNQIIPPHQLRKNMVSIQRFECVIYDYSNNKVFQKIEPDLELNEE